MFFIHVRLLQFPPWFFKSDAEVRKAAKVGWKAMKEGVKRSSSGRLIPIHEGEEKLDLPVLGMDGKTAYKLWFATGITLCVFYCSRGPFPESEGEKEEEESPQAEYSKFSLQIPSDAPLAILFVHGGGFVGSSYASDMRHMARWAQESNAAVRGSFPCCFVTLLSFPLPHPLPSSPCHLGVLCTLLLGPRINIPKARG